MCLYTSVNYEIICKASATRLTFLVALATQHFFLKLQGLRSQDVTRVTIGRFCNKIAGTMLPNISVRRLFIQLNFLTCLQILRQQAAGATTFDFSRRTALRMSSCHVENCRCSVSVISNWVHPPGQSPGIS